MHFLDTIFSLVWDISDWFYNLYLNVPDWPIIRDWIKTPLLFISNRFWDLLTPIAHFNDWVHDVNNKVKSILSSVDIISLLRTWLTYAENAWNWVVNSWTNVRDIVDTWWSSASLTVQAWIEDAVSGVQTLVDQANIWLANLQAAWDDLKGRIPTLDEVVSWWTNWTGQVLAFVNTWWTGALLEVQGLINSAFVERASWWAGWSDFRDQVVTFFTDPVEFIWERATNWFLGPEE